MKHCGNCDNYIWGDGKTPLPEDCLTCQCDLTGEDKGPSNWRPQSMTNSERIRTFSGKELEHFFVDKGFCPPGYECATYFGNCRECWHEWLQQPADTGTDTNVGSK